MKASAETAPRPVPKVTSQLAPFLQAAKAHRLVVQRCSACGVLRFPAREVCSACWSREMDWVPVSGRGVIQSFYWMHQVYHPGFIDQVPYAVIVVKLEEGPTITSNIVECGKEALQIGLAVEAVFEDVNEEITLPKFRPQRSD